MAPAQSASLLVLRRLSNGSRDSADLSPSDAEPNPAGRPLVAHCDIRLQAVRQATRHAWLALETALAGPSLWKKLVGTKGPAAQESVFRQQMDALLDLLSLAGLESDDADTRRRCREEMRAARQAGLLAVESLDACEPELQALSPFTPNGLACRHEEPGDTERHALDGIARELRHMGYSQLARLVSLRSPWDEPLFLGVVEYFLVRSFRAHPALAIDLPNLPEGHSGVCWRCLEMTARLLDERQEAIEELVDHAETTAGPPETSDEKAVERLFQKGLHRYLNGEYQKAATHFTAALKLDPTDARLYAHRGDAYRLMCEYERAIADFHVALRLNPSDPSFFVNRAVAFHLTGENDRAVADCSAALALSPKNAAAYRTRAAAYAEKGADEQALADWTRAIELAPADDGSLYQRGVIHAAKRDYAAAVADFDKVLALNPHHVPAYLHRGHAHRCRGDYTSAIIDYTEVLRQHPNNVIAYANRGLAHKLKGDPDRALSDYTEALRLDPSNARVYYSRGVLYRARGDHERALADLDEAVRREQDNWAALYHRGKIFLGLGEFPKALADLTASLSFNPRVVVTHLSRAVVYDRLGRYAEGILDGTRAVELDAKSPAAYLVRGVLRSHVGDYAAAVTDLTDAIRLDEGFALAYCERSMARTLQGDYDGALADCDKLLTLEPKNARAYANRSVIHHFRGEIQQALTDYARALQIDPRCVLTGWNQCLAENARAEGTRRLADYIDGLRHDPPVADLPPPPKFRIVLQPANAPGVAAAPVAVPAPPPTPPPAPPPAAVKEATAPIEVPAQTYALATESASLVRLPVPAPTVTDESGPAPKAQPAAEPAAAAGATQTHALSESTSSTRIGGERTLPAGPRKKKKTKARKHKPLTESSAQDAAIADLLADSEERPDTIGFLDEGPAESTAAAPAKAGPPRPPPIVVRCPACGATGIATERLAGGRVRCRACKQLFLPSGPRPAPSPAAAVPAPVPVPGNPFGPPGPVRPPVAMPVPQRPTRRAQEDEGEDTKPAWKRPGRLAAVAAVLALLYFCPRLWTSGHPRVHPGHGQAFFEEEPIAGANIVLDPTWEADPPFPRPHATVKEDGSFALETYGHEDGAPAGEYKVAVTWFEPVKGEDDVPRNFLPSKYAGFQTSGLTVRIEPGANQIPPFKLNR
jgi:tetratricopeptide (TPR) repeat protein